MSTQSSIISWVKLLFEYQVAYETLQRPEPLRGYLHIYLCFVCQFLDLTYLFLRGRRLFALAVSFLGRVHRQKASYVFSSIFFFKKIVRLKIYLQLTSKRSPIAPHPEFIRKLFYSN